jgi:hypothetical protein
VCSFYYSNSVEKDDLEDSFNRIYQQSVTLIDELNGHFASLGRKEMSEILDVLEELFEKTYQVLQFQQAQNIKTLFVKAINRMSQGIVEMPKQLRKF